MTVATAILAFCTFLLALGTFLIIYDARSARKRDKKYDIVEQIANWAIEAVNLHHRHGDIEPALVADLMEKETDTQSRALAAIEMKTVLEQRERCTMVIARGGYLGSLAEKFDSELAEVIKDTVKAVGVVIDDMEPILDKMRTEKKPVSPDIDFEPVITASYKVLERARDLAAP